MFSRRVSFCHLEHLARKCRQPRLLTNSSSTRFFAAPSLASTPEPSKIRNLAVVAHVDHGKTTLVDQMLKYAGKLAESRAGVDRVMDSNDLERERGITILSKCTSIGYEGHKINILDTPGHADFGGEVERILSMVDSVILLMDVLEGPMPQTKFVLSKALKAGLCPIVVLNKIDRPNAPERVDDASIELMELFETLGASTEQIEKIFDNIVYASALNGWAVTDMDTQERNGMAPLMTSIIDLVPPPVVQESEGGFKMMTSMMSHDKQWGRLLTGKLAQGTIQAGNEVKALDLDGKEQCRFTAKQIIFHHGTEKEKMAVAAAGDIISIAGAGDLGGVTSTLCAITESEPLKADPIEPSVLRFLVTHNDSPLHGKDGKKFQKADIEKRLEQELKHNVCISVEKNEMGEFEVGVRGELQLAILVENMRREGYELQIGAPQINYKVVDGKQHEPIERLKFFDIETTLATSIIEKFSQRFGEVHVFEDTDGLSRLEVVIPSRVLMGFNADFKRESKGQGVLVREFDSYQPFKGEIRKNRSGAIVSVNGGTATKYALKKAEERAKGSVLFVEPGDDVYEGQILGESMQEKDFECSATREKFVIGAAVAGGSFVTDVKRKLPPLEEAVAWIQDDEYVEVTPTFMRMRKTILSSADRGRIQKNLNNQKRKAKSKLSGKPL